MIPRRRIPIRATDFAEFFRALRRGGTAARADVSAFEAAFAGYLGCGFARATASGRDAMELALDAVGAGAGDQVIIPACTLGELVPLLRAKGLVPVPADIEPDTFNMDVGSVAAHVTARTRVILALHAFGAPCDIEGICSLARRRGLRVVEDCAHALGAAVGGRKVGTFGDAALFSFEVNKAVPTYGGGMVVLNDPGIAASVSQALDARRRTELPALRKALASWREEAVIRSPAYGPLARIIFSEALAPVFERRYRGAHDRLRKEKVAYSGFQARLGLERLGELDARNDRLNRRWEALAGELPPGLVPQRRDRAGRPAFHNFVALSADTPPSQLRRLAQGRGVDLGVGSEVIDDCARLLGAADCPVAADIARRAVLLPLYEGLSDSRFRRVTTVLNGILSRQEG